MIHSGLPEYGVEYDEGIGTDQGREYPVGVFIPLLDPQDDEGDKQAIDGADDINEGDPIQFQCHAILLYGIASCRVD